MNWLFLILRLLGILFLSNMLACSNARHDSSIHNAQRVSSQTTIIGSEAFQTSLACSNSAEDKAKQVAIIAKDMLRECNNRKVPGQINCEDSCPLVYEKVRGVYTNIELEMRQVFSENGESSNQFRFDFVPPTKIEIDAVRCVNPENTPHAEFLYETLFKTVCEDHSKVEIPSQSSKSSSSKVSRSVGDLSWGSSISYEKSNNACATNLVDTIFKKFEQGLSSMQNSNCPSGSFENYKIGILDNNANAQSKLISIASNGRDGFDFTLWATGIHSLINSINGESQVRVRNLATCYPLRIHPARQKLRKWMLRHWEGLSDRAGCPNQPPPFVLGL